jgi:hypothetical protein
MLYHFWRFKNISLQEIGHKLQCTLVLPLLISTTLSFLHLMVIITNYIPLVDLYELLIRGGGVSLLSGKYSKSPFNVSGI